MSFTVICDLCGTKQIFKQGDKARNAGIDISVFMEHSYLGSDVREIDIGCENPKCPNLIELDY
jgi:hypothetical protein